MITRSNRYLFIKVAVAAAILATTYVGLSRTKEFKDLILHFLELLRSVGPVAFFFSMALLPALGVPLSIFCLTAGSVFGPKLGTAPVLVLSLAAITANMALCHVLARRAMRPLLQQFLQRLGYKLPQLASGDFTDLIVLLRVTPGLPFPIQNYLLGLGGVPFVRYLLVSCLIALPLNAAIIIFGEALLQGRGRRALIGLLLVLAVMVAIHTAGRHYKRKGKALD